MSELIERLREREVPDWLRALYGVIYLATFTHLALTRGAWTCCPPAYGDDLATFAHIVQISLGWTGVAVAFLEVTTFMVLLVPKVYYGIKNKGIAEGKIAGIVEGKREGRAEGIAEGKIAGRAEGIAEGKREGMAAGERSERERIAAELESKLDAAGITDPETRRMLMDATRNGR